MTAKPAALPFQPAPRPQARVSPEQSRELAEAARDLGFGRTTSSPGGPEPEIESPAAQQPSATDVLKPRITAAPTPIMAETAPKPAVAVERQAMLKVAVGDELWTALRHEALNRRVTVKYLVMEALAQKGYAIDLSQVAEDGRRQR